MKRALGVDQGLVDIIKILQDDITPEYEFVQRVIVSRTSDLPIAIEKFEEKSYPVRWGCPGGRVHEVPVSVHGGNFKRSRVSGVGRGIYVETHVLHHLGEIVTEKGKGPPVREHENVFADRSGSIIMPCYLPQEWFHILKKVLLSVSFDNILIFFVFFYIPEGLFFVLSTKDAARQKKSNYLCAMSCQSKGKDYICIDSILKDSN